MDKLTRLFPSALNRGEAARKDETSHEDTVQGTKALLAQMQSAQGPYEAPVLGRSYTVHDGVFSHLYAPSTAWYAEYLPVQQGDSFLEIGCGTCVISVTAADRGAARVTAIDINPAAVANAKENVKKFGMEDRIEVRLGDVYDSLTPEERYDVIFWNSPFVLLENEQQLSDLERSAFDIGYAAHERFISQARQHLTERGRLFIGFSKTLGDYGRLQQLAEKYGYEIRPVREAESVEKHAVHFEMLELVPTHMK